MQLNPGHIIPKDKVQAYILAGQATIGLHSRVTGNSFWYWVTKKNDGIWYVYLNYAVPEENKYIGHITFRDGKYWYLMPDGAKQWSPLKQEYAGAFHYAWKKIISNSVPDQLVFYHQGRCGYCGRPLTDPVSMIAGIGPVCRKRLGI